MVLKVESDGSLIFTKTVLCELSPTLRKLFESLIDLILTGGVLHCFFSFSLSPGWGILKNGKPKFEFNPRTSC